MHYPTLQAALCAACLRWVPIIGSIFSCVSLTQAKHPTRVQIIIHLSSKQATRLNPKSNKFNPKSHLILFMLLPTKTTAQISPEKGLQNSHQEYAKQ